jgi:hypothetical protein
MPERNSPPETIFRNVQIQLLNMGRYTKKKLCCHKKIIQNKMINKGINKAKICIENPSTPKTFSEY